MGSKVSCLMPTRNRRPHVPRAVACFLDQTYGSRELVILDDGEDCVRDLIPSDPRIRYFQIDRAISHGQKLAWMAQIAAGDFFAFWDDDDWHGPERLARQVAALRAGADVVLLDNFVGYDMPCDHAYIWSWRSFGAFADGTGAFSRRFYRSGQPFDGDARHPGQRLLSAQQEASIEWIDGSDLYIQVLHDANSATTHMQGAGWRPADAETTAITRLRLERARIATKAVNEEPQRPAAPLSPPAPAPPKKRPSHPPLPPARRRSG